MLILYYPMKKIGDSLTIKESVMIVWGGLRGALALALALIVATDPETTEDFGRR